ncbi:hypothetical protein A3K02_01025 [candidate division WS6 bacterium RIFOXYD1_FULL_33_8]|uniref:Uncharacterized protein n=2 Tax=Candidatus Dojkabacteria TaxID=74243 RepID=A0A0G0CTW3_9BACT|nr:MAG: hypothetical protein UR32_C0011G0009 [candidate division WS6 bacterium GW2011_GWE2_33_157]KKP44095.1 MAG: hypothetical protein UR34_C0006G0016 [candidate division WS6 bacterium GW2011_GWC1_33_20]KKP45032.1 MAG: hypothetical protein UR36_C0011G0009 [candidate division WS6 bacterium GW2011_GWF1_33_233]KKP54503.1 MAG: hypothetical protein UR45_C0013G0009 [candidate division WS6 bacterium GW2011_WS6_33_547]KKP54570.1 MAG: hypothetical protein UR47_C0014G0012 [candidate division WS6 bacteriu
MSQDTHFKIIEGFIPVLLSAPHVHAHRRPSLTLSYKQGEPLTDYIVEQICLMTGAWGIIQTDQTDFDPNYHKLEENPYKEAVLELVEKGKVKKFVDIHGLNPQYEYDLGIYYPSKFFKSICLADDVCRGVDKRTLRGINSCVFRFDNDNRESLGEFVASKLRVPSVQVEIAKYIREKEELRKPFIENLAAVLRV